MDEETTLHAVMSEEPWPGVVCGQPELLKSIQENSRTRAFRTFSTPDGRHAIAPGNSRVNCPECLRKTTMLANGQTGWTEIHLPGTGRMHEADLAEWAVRLAEFMENMEKRSGELLEENCQDDPGHTAPGLRELAGQAREAAPRLRDISKARGPARSAHPPGRPGRRRGSVIPADNRAGTQGNLNRAGEKHAHHRDRPGMRGLHGHRALPGTGRVPERRGRTPHLRGKRRTPAGDSLPGVHREFTERKTREEVSRVYRTREEKQDGHRHTHPRGPRTHPGGLQLLLRPPNGVRVYFRTDGTQCRDEQGREILPCKHEDRILKTPHVFAGESFWPFPAHLPKSREEREKLPDPAGELVEAFPPGGELPVTITRERIERTRKAVQLPEELAARYGQYAPEERQLKIVRFLEKHEGRGAFLLFY